MCSRKRRSKEERIGKEKMERQGKKKNKKRKHEMECYRLRFLWRQNVLILRILFLFEYEFVLFFKMDFHLFAICDIMMNDRFKMRFYYRFFKKSGKRPTPIDQINKFVIIFLIESATRFNTSKVNCTCTGAFLFFKHSIIIFSTSFGLVSDKTKFSSVIYYYMNLIN